MDHLLVIVLLTIWTSVTSVQAQTCYASCARNCHVCANIDTSGVALKSDWSENALPSETRAVPLGSDVYINGQRIGTINCASTNGAICIKGNGLEIEGDVMMTTGEFGLECRCNSKLEECSVTTVGLFSGKHELYDVTSVACGPCATDGEEDGGHSMPMRIVPDGSFDYQDVPTEPQSQPTVQSIQPQFVNEPVIRNEDSATFFGKIVRIPGDSADSDEGDFVEFCTNLDTGSIIDSDWEERATGSKTKRSDPKNFQGDGQFIGTVTCASTNGEICVREEARNTEKAIFINHPIGLLCRCTTSGCSAGTFGFGDGRAEDQLTDVVYVGCGPCHINRVNIPSTPPTPPPTDSSEEIHSFGPAPLGELPQELPFDALPNAFVPPTPPAPNGRSGPPASVPLRLQPIAPSARFNPHLTIVPARSRAAPTVDNIPAVNAEKPLGGRFLHKAPPPSVCAGFSTLSVTSEDDWVEQKHPSQTVAFVKGSDLYPHTAVIGTLTCWDTGKWQSCITGKRANGTLGTFESAQYTSTTLECRCTSPYSCHVVSKGFEPDLSNQFVDITRVRCGRC